MGHGSRQPAKFLSMAELARHREPDADRGHRPDGNDSLRHGGARRPGALAVQTARTRGSKTAESQSTGLDVFARAEIAVVLDRVKGVANASRREVEICKVKRLS